MKYTKTRRTIACVAVAMLAGAVVMGSPAGAHVTDGFRHLYKKHIKPKLATPGTINRSSNPVHWSKLKGVPGELADGGDATGVRGYEIVQDGELIPASSDAFLSIDCPPDKRVVGGGASAIDGSSSEHNAFVRMIESYPYDGSGSSGWAAFMLNDDSSAADAQVYAICVNN
jgi:hypothetical protein